ncbi:hypothetical protein [Natrinema caseinilyticum]|uniref:hypothetical protein n=1 Tax=Natrinema caseinilyticum TaxID=2961570 RepID=UPI0020C3268C|nr:hypothetical protein [Natrinema caseinilyticum]
MIEEMGEQLTQFPCGSAPTTGQERAEITANVRLVRKADVIHTPSIIDPTRWEVKFPPINAPIGTVRNGSDITTQGSIADNPPSTLRRPILSLILLTEAWR